MRRLPMPIRLLAATALLMVFIPIASQAATPNSDEDTTREFKLVMQKRGDTAVPVKFVMSVSGAGSEQQQEGQTQGTLVSADGLILVPGRVVSLDLSMFGRGGSNGGLGGSAPTVKSGQFRVRLAGSDEWLPADLVTRDTELGLAWLRLRHPHGKLPYVELADPAKIAVGTQLFTVMRTSDQFGSVPIVRAGYVLGETTVPHPGFLIDGTPGVAFDGEGKPAGFVDVDLGAMMRARTSTGGIGMDYGDQVFSMIPADRLGRVTAQAAVLPVVKSSDADDADLLPDPKPARKHAPPAPPDAKPADSTVPLLPADAATKDAAAKDAAVKDAAAKDAVSPDAGDAKKH